MAGLEDHFDIIGELFEKRMPRFFYAGTAAKSSKLFDLTNNIITYSLKRFMDVCIINKFST